MAQQDDYYYEIQLTNKQLVFYFLAGATGLILSFLAGVMVGRGAYGAPWLPGRIGRFLASGRDPGAPGLSEQGRIAIRHVEAMLAHYGTALGLRNARKHIGWYLAASGKDAASVKAWRQMLCTDDDPRRVLRGLASFYDLDRDGAEGLAA